MKRQTLLVTMIALTLTLPGFAGNKKKNNRAMIEKMEAVPCGAKERGLSGLGSIWASIGATHIDSDEKLCPQYMLRTDDMEYHVRPMDKKHPVILPVGKEGEFKISKDVMEMRIPDGDHKKRRYQVVAMKPIDHTAAPEESSYNSHKSYSDKPLDTQSSVRRSPVKSATDPNAPPQ